MSDVVYSEAYATDARSAALFAAAGVKHRRMNRQVQCVRWLSPVPSMKEENESAEKSREQIESKDAAPSASTVVCDSHMAPFVTEQESQTLIE